MSDLPIPINWLLQTTTAFISVSAFAVIFQVPGKQRIFTGLTGAVGWLTYLISIHFQASTVTASFLAATLLTVLARMFSYLRKEPVTTFLICGIFPIVPGTGIYSTAYAFFMGDNFVGQSKAFETIKIAVAIAFGIGIVLSLPPFLFFGAYAKKQSVVNDKSDSA